MRTEDFDFDLPRELIAQRPASPRDSARLLAVRDGLTNHRVADLPALLAPGDLLVANDTRVIPARLAGRRDSAGIEVTLHRHVGGSLWHAFARPARKLKQGDRIDFASELSATVAAKRAGGEVALDFALPPGELLARLERVGAMPLPPYIKRPDGPEPADLGDYQTIFASRPGAVAAPTAGLHFTPGLLDALAARSIDRVVLTLHVGAGTFLPVKVEDPRDHRMHLEAGQLSEAAARTINAARAAGGRIVAVGTTALRLLEAAAAADGTVEPFAGETGIYILPGYRFRAVDLLFTNFHLPRSTLFMLVCAFAGRARMLQAYEHAKTSGYRFFSYGDSCLLWPERPR